MTLLHELISDAATRHSAAPALVGRSESLTYSELADLVARVATGLSKSGLRRGDRVAVFLPKQIETVVSFFAASRAGGMFVPVNPILKPAQVGYILRDSGATVFVTSAERAGALAAELDACPSLRLVIIVGGYSGDDRDPRYLDWSGLLDSKGDPSPSQVDSDPVAILYTSGSTGKPKGVVLSQRNMVAGAKSVASYLDNTNDDRLLAVLPLSFDYGFSQLSTAFVVGASVALMDYLLPRDVLRAAERFHVTGLAAVPPLWIQLAALEWPESVRNQLRYITNSGGAMPVDTLQNLRRKLPKTSVFLMYGLTEAFRSTYLPPDQADVRPTSIGKAIPNVEVLVIRPDGTECAANEPGELVHRGPLVALGYWGDADRTAQRFRPSPVASADIPIKEIAVWSGDTVVRDEDGYLYFVGRRDEMIKTSGYRVSPTEVEEIVHQSGLVSETVALGAPHPSLGQVVVVIAVSIDSHPESTEELLAYCRSQMPNYMVPAHVVWRDSMPRNANGKIDRSLLADHYRSAFEDVNRE